MDVLNGHRRKHLEKISKHLKLRNVVTSPKQDCNVGGLNSVDVSEELCVDNAVQTPKTDTKKQIEEQVGQDEMETFLKENDIEDHFRSSHNSYAYGPGESLNSRQMNTIYKNGKVTQKSGPVKLFVCRIPRELTKTGIENIFKLYGTVLSVNLTDNRVAFITYENENYAELGMHHLNNAHPFFFKIEIARERKIEKLIKDNDWNDNVPLESAVVPKRECVFAVKKGIDYSEKYFKSKAEEQVQDEDEYTDNNRYEAHNNVLRRYKVDSEAKNKYKLPPTRAVYQEPEQVLKVAKIYEEKMAEFYDSEKNILTNMTSEELTKQCKVCNGYTFRKCTQCLVYYCSSKCQQLEHKEKCSPA